MWSGRSSKTRRQRRSKKHAEGPAADFITFMAAYSIASGQAVAMKDCILFLFCAHDLCAVSFKFVAEAFHNRPRCGDNACEGDVNRFCVSSVATQKEVRG